jgi:hypothetical protein
MKKLKINNKEIYLFLRDGTPIFNYFDINTNIKTIFVSNYPFFRGINNLYFPSAQ